MDDEDATSAPGSAFPAAEQPPRTRVGRAAGAACPHLCGHRRHRCRAHPWPAGGARLRQAIDPAPARLPLLGGGQPGGFGPTPRAAKAVNRVGRLHRLLLPVGGDAGRHATDSDGGGTQQPRGVQAASGPGRYGCSGAQSSRHRCGGHSHSAHAVSHVGGRPRSGGWRSRLRSTTGRARYSQSGKNTL